MNRALTMRQNEHALLRPNSEEDEYHGRDNVSLRCWRDQGTRLEKRGHRQTDVLQHCNRYTDESIAPNHRMAYARNDTVAIRTIDQKWLSMLVYLYLRVR